jgi:hypothetical protein
MLVHRLVRLDVVDARFDHGRVRQYPAVPQSVRSKQIDRVVGPRLLL